MKPTPHFLGIIFSLRDTKIWYLYWKHSGWSPVYLTWIWCFTLWFHNHSYSILFQLLEENIVNFVKNELKKILNILGPDYPEWLESHGKDEELLKAENEKQMNSSREAFVKLTLHFLRMMKQAELADHLESSKRVTLNI